MGQFFGEKNTRKDEKGRGSDPRRCPQQGAGMKGLWGDPTGRRRTVTETQSGGGWALGRCDSIG